MLGVATALMAKHENENVLSARSTNRCRELGKCRELSKRISLLSLKESTQVEREKSLSRVCAALCDHLDVC